MDTDASPSDPPCLLCRRLHTRLALSKRVETDDDTNSVWHRSGPNQTDRPRRVFYAQYSVDVIRAAPSDPRPLSLAVPCLPRPRCSTNAPIGVASSSDERDADRGVGAGGGEEARRRGGEVESSPSRPSVGDDGGRVGDGRRQHAEGEATPSRASLPAVKARTMLSKHHSLAVVGGAAAPRRRRRSDEEGTKRDVGEEAGVEGSKRTRGQLGVD